MNYYELKDFKSIVATELIDLFNTGKTVTSGGIYVYSDTIGTPGDIIFKLTNIIVEDEKLIFEFGISDKIIFYNPMRIVSNLKVIGIQRCKKVLWIDKNMNRELEYSIDGDLVKTQVLKGEHGFRVKPNSPALLFYTW